MSALVQAADLLAELRSDGEPPLLLDVRWTLAGADLPAYLTGHLPGAVFCDLDAELAAPPGDGGRHPLPDEEALTATMRRLGVAPGRAVVVYDGGNAMAASRAWWVLRWAGHEQVRVLDGGLPAWVSAGGELQTGPDDPVAAPDARARTGALPTVGVDEVAAGTAGVLVDVRAAQRFRGEQEPVDPVAGHVPGAVSCPANRLMGDGGRYLPPEELREVLGPLVERGRVAASCGSGVTATQLVLALHELGTEAALFPGSWSQWVRDPARPVATGP